MPFLPSTASVDVTIDEMVVPTTTAITVTPNPAQQGADLTVTAIVSGAYIPVGSLQFHIDGVASGPLLLLDAAGWVQQVVVADLTVGVHVFSAEFIP